MTGAVNNKEPFLVPSAGDLIGPSHRGSEMAWSPGSFCKGSGQSLRLFVPASFWISNSSLASEIFQATILHNSEGCDSYYSQRLCGQTCCLIPGFGLFVWNLRNRQLSAWIWNWVSLPGWHLQSSLVQSGDQSRLMQSTIPWSSRSGPCLKVGEGGVEMTQRKTWKLQR